MRPILSPVISNEEVMPGVYLMWADAPRIASSARPGQFVMVRSCADHERLLRRPLSIHRVRADGRIALLYEIIGKGTEWLSLRTAGEMVDLLGPLGNGFRVESKNLLLVAGGCGIAPLVFLTEKALDESRDVVMLIGANTAKRIYPQQLLPEGLQAEIFTEDGSSGKRGLCTDPFSNDGKSLAGDVVQIFACGPADMYRKMAKIDWLKGKSVQVSLEARMGCGFGVCFGCTIETKRGLKRVCRDGPIFELSDLNI